MVVEEVKETTDAAIEDSIDVYYLRTCGVYRLDKEKFVESFLYRFADSVDNTRSYKIGFYDINEVPPKVSVKVDSMTAVAFKAKTNQGEKNIDTNISTSYDAILETKYFSDLAVEEGIKFNGESVKTYDQCRALIDTIKND